MARYTLGEWRRQLIVKVCKIGSYILPDDSDLSWGSSSITVSSLIDAYGKNELARGWVRGTRSNGEVVDRQIVANDNDATGRLIIQVSPAFPETPLRNVEVLRPPLEFSLFDEVLRRTLDSADVLFFGEPCATYAVYQGDRPYVDLPDWSLLSDVRVEASLAGGSRVVGFGKRDIEYLQFGGGVLPVAIATRFVLTAPLRLVAAGVGLGQGETLLAPGGSERVLVSIRAEDPLLQLPQSTDLDNAQGELVGAELPSAPSWVVAELPRTVHLFANVPYWLVVRSSGHTSATSYRVVRSSSVSGQVQKVATSNGSSWSDAPGSSFFFVLIAEGQQELVLSEERGEWRVDVGSVPARLYFGIGRGFALNDGAVLRLVGRKPRKPPVKDTDLVDVDAEWFLCQAAADLLESSSYHDRMLVNMATNYLQRAQLVARMRRMAARGVVLRQS